MSQIRDEIDNMSHSELSTVVQGARAILGETPVDDEWTKEQLKEIDSLLKMAGL